VGRAQAAVLAHTAWIGHKLSTMETVGHIIRVKKQLNFEAALNDLVTMALDADELGASVFDRLIELRWRDPRRQGSHRAGGLHQRALGMVLESS
jgi:hypothetical protein